MSDFKPTATFASFGGKLLKLTHYAVTTGCEMALNLYLPPEVPGSKKIPVLFYLSGLTCTGDNCAEKGFFQQGASQKGIAIVYPDTSPRKLNTTIYLQGVSPKLAPGQLPVKLPINPADTSCTRRVEY